ncbi:hypothetical protein [Parabacteroides merdae]|jgi:hypothetical protein|uniref:hypothetical protein n=1 Tax=Parabacteroides merdae TaxID=46503 RepID=UPI0034A437B5
METKMITIPFDVELAKEIQAGAKPGKIITKDGRDARIVCWDMESEMNYPYIILVKGEKFESVYQCNDDGKCKPSLNMLEIVLEIPEYAHHMVGSIKNMNEIERFINLMKQNSLFERDTEIKVLDQDVWNKKPLLKANILDSVENIVINIIYIDENKDILLYFEYDNGVDGSGAISLNDLLDGELSILTDYLFNGNELLANLISVDRVGNWID